MKNLSLISLLLLLTISLNSCDVIGGIFKAGMGVGIFLVLAIAVVIVWLISRSRK